MTCYNRKARTLYCLQQLFDARERTANIALKVFLLDDASPDGTGDVVLSVYPEVTVIRGTGQLFWNRGMHRAMEVSTTQSFDYYLWLNDDTILNSHSIKNLMDTMRWCRTRTGAEGIVVGTTESSEGSGIPTYGGRNRVSKFRPLRFELVSPAHEPRLCQTMNGNCVLIPAAVVQRIGLLDPIFRHSMGDTDYGFRAGKAGFKLWVMPGFAGVCEKNSSEGEWVDPKVPLVERLQKVILPKALPPLSWGIYTKRHAGMLWPLLWIWPYLNIVRTSLIRSLGIHRE